MANTPQGAVGDTLLDANGATITMGATVKLVGTVTGINTLSAHFRDIEVTLSHPITGVANPGISPLLGNSYVEGAHNTQPGSCLKINVAGCNLVVGA